MSNLLIGQTLDRYQLLSELGPGELGVVYKAHDPSLERTVAVKVIELRRLGPPEAVERLLDRARTAARLDHPGLVKVHDFGRTKTVAYIVMEYIPGGSLRELLRQLREANQWVLLSEAVNLVRHLALVMDYLGRQGQTRRLRPADIRFKPDPLEGLPYRPVLTDLGLAEALPPPADGAPDPGYAYWSPEQVLSQPLTDRSQVYSLGVLLYELAVGWLPFPVSTLADAVRAQGRAEPPPPRQRRADLPAALEEIILRALARQPDDRYASPADLAAALKDVLPVVEQAEAAPEAGGWAVSLLVPYQRSLRDEQPPPPERWPEPPTPPTLGEVPETMNLSQGRIRVVGPDGQVRFNLLPARGLTIGRSAGNDLVMEDPAVAPFHARVEYDGRQYRLIDLNSPSGTYVNGVRLLPGMPEAWLPEIPVLVGQTWLYLEPPAVVAARPSVFRFDGMVVDASLVQSSPGGRVGVYVEVPQITVTPGQRTTAAFVVVNQGPDPDRLSVTLDGLPPTWIAPPGPATSVQLAPGGHQRLKVAIEPARSAASHAGRYTLAIRVGSQSRPDERVEARIAVSVASFAQFAASLSAQTGRVNDVWRLTVNNQGNVNESYTVAFEDPQDELTFDPPGATLAVPEGHAGVLDYSVALQRPRLIGTRRVHPYGVRIASSTGQAQRLNAEVLSSALVPPWAPLLALFFCCLLSGVAALAYSSYNGQAAATGTAAARQTAQAFANADLDGDGLSNAAEVQLGTDPLKPDTDGDGLLDGEEAGWGANPLVADSDGDTLPDGREVKELHSSPINPDTDGDGLADNVDPAPGEAPTPTPSPTLTPTATETPTPAPPTDTPPASPTATETPTVPAATATATVVVAPTFDPALGVLVFESRRDGNPELYLMAANGDGQARLTNNTGADTSAAWSATRQRLVFVSDRDGNPELYSMGIDGAGQSRLTNNAAADNDPAWSPDGSRIAFVSDRDGNPEIYLVGADGGDPVRVTNNAAADTDPSWSPDGSQLLFVSERDGNREVYVVNLDGSGLVNLSRNAARDEAASFSPNGSFIVFVSNRDGNEEVYLMNPDGTTQLRLTNNSSADTAPAWAPNAARLAFVRDDGGNAEIYVMNADGTGQTRLTTASGADDRPVWAPDGSRLAFRSSRDGNAEVYVVGVDGSGTARLTNDPAEDVPWVWR